MLYPEPLKKWRKTKILRGETLSLSYTKKNSKKFIGAKIDYSFSGRH
jgi:hypothetical protein